MASLDFKLNKWQWRSTAETCCREYRMYMYVYIYIYIYALYVPVLGLRLTQLQLSICSILFQPLKIFYHSEGTTFSCSHPNTSIIKPSPRNLCIVAWNKKTLKRTRNTGGGRKLRCSFWVLWSKCQMCGNWYKEIMCSSISNSFAEEYLWQKLLPLVITVAPDFCFLVLNTDSRVRVGKNLSEMFPIRNGLKQGDALSPLLFNFALEYAIKGFR